MTAENLGVKSTYWRETIVALRQFAQTEWQWIAVFAVIVALQELMLFPKISTAEMQPLLEEAGQDTARILEILNQFYPKIIADSLVRLATVMCGACVFSILFMRHMLAEEAAAFSLRTIGRWSWAVVRKALVLSLPFIVLLGAVFIAAFVLDPAVMQKEIFVQTLAVLMAGSLLLLFWGVYRLYLVSPLVLIGDQTPIRSSWGMSKGHLMRIMWGSFVLILLCYFIFLLPIISVNVLAKVSDMPQQNLQHLAATFQGLFRGTMIVVTSIYACVVCLILRKKADSLLLAEHD